MGTCQSCGRDEDVEAVQRVYLLEGTEATAGSGEPPVRVDDDVEYWCFTCRESYPHVPVT